MSHFKNSYHCLLTEDEINTFYNNINNNILNDNEIINNNNNNNNNILNNNEIINNNINNNIVNNIKINKCIKCNKIFTKYLPSMNFSVDNFCSSEVVLLSANIGNFLY